MPRRTYEIVSCDVCGDDKQRELLPKKEPADGWLELCIKNPKDLREKVKPVICPSCVAAIIDASVKATLAEPEAAEPSERAA